MSWSHQAVILRPYIVNCGMTSPKYVTLDARGLKDVGKGAQVWRFEGNGQKADIDGKNRLAIWVGLDMFGYCVHASVCRVKMSQRQFEVGNGRNNLHCRKRLPSAWHFLDGHRCGGDMGWQQKQGQRSSWQATSFIKFPRVPSDLIVSYLICTSCLDLSSWRTAKTEHKWVSTIVMVQEQWHWDRDCTSNCLWPIQDDRAWSFRC